MTSVIAEIGWNHGGDITLACAMIDAAATAGASFAKFQTWSVSRLKPGPWDYDGRREIYKNAELSESDHLALFAKCQKSHIEFLTSIFCADDVEFVASIGCNSVKIASTEARNKKLLERINEVFSGKRVFMSTGAHSLAEINEAVSFLKDVDLTLMHCVSAYPCQPACANLPRIDALKTICKNVGYSGHCVGILDAIIALAFKPTVIEKHFTTDRSLPGRDNKFAVLPDELRLLCDLILNEHLYFTSTGNDYQDCEVIARELYSGRWNG